MGIGGNFIRLTMNEAVKNLPKLEIITLTVFSNNLTAYNIYKKLGFYEFGRLPNGVIHKKSYKDRIYMFKNIKKIIDK